MVMENGWIIFFQICLLSFDQYDNNMMTGVFIYHVTVTVSSPDFSVAHKLFQLATKLFPKVKSIICNRIIFTSFQWT